MATPKTKTTTPIDTTYAHVQPQATDVERVVLGALMIDKDAFSVVSELIRPETFYDPKHQKIYHAIQTLNMDENPVDIMTVIDQLKREGTLDEIGGAPYVLELSSQVASSANIEYHAKIIAQKSLARQLISYASMIETKAFDETQDIAELMQEAEGNLFTLSQTNMKKDYTQIDPIIAQATDILQKASANTGDLTGIPSGFTKLDEITSGWQKSDLVIIAGRPAMGKTSFALKIADTFFKDSKSVFLAKNGEQRFSELIDCVTVAPFAANENSPIIFASTKNNLTESEKDFFDKLNPHKITLVGGGLHPKFDEIIGKTPPKKEYVLLNVSQINQNKAGLPMGCEAASLLQCLHYKNIKTNTNIHQFIKEMPLAKDNNPNHGFAGSPFNIDERIYQSIFPEPLTKWANKYATAENISGKSSEYIREEIAKGNPVIFFATYKFRNPTFKDYFWGKNALYNAHVMVVDGYDKNRMHIVDPAEDKPNGYWISRSLFDSRYNIKKYAVVVR